MTPFSPAIPEGERPPSVAHDSETAIGQPVVHSSCPVSDESDVDDGVDFFSVQGARDRQRLEEAE